MEIKDKELLEIYMKGFNDELNNNHDSSFTNSLSVRAYELGRTDALLGDDVMSLDYQTNEEILKRIKNG